MKKRKTRGTKTLIVKHETIYNKKNNIKTEEVKLELLLSECDIVDIPIKQEEKNVEVKLYGTTLNQSAVGFHDTAESKRISLKEPSIDNNVIERTTNTTELSLQFDCQYCNLKFKSERLYNIHVNKMHGLESNNQLFHCQTHLRRRSKPNHSIKPDPDDPNFYCKSCGTKYAINAKFRNHIRYMHKTVNLPSKRTKPNYSIKPDPNDPNFYCKSCDTHYEDISSFRKQILNVHKTVELSDFYCKSCATKCTSSVKFRNHIRRLHKTIILPPLQREPRSKPNHSIKPDPDNQTRTEFRQHLRAVHKMPLEPLKKIRKVNAKP